MKDLVFNETLVFTARANGEELGPTNTSNVGVATVCVCVCVCVCVGKKSEQITID